MSKIKYIDKICIAVLSAILLITLIFMAVGKSGMTGDDGEIRGSIFSSDDLDGDHDFSSAEKINLTRNGADPGSYGHSENGNVYINRVGSYVLSGELDGGSVIISADNGTVHLLLDGAKITSDGNPAILVEQAKKVILTLADKSESSVSSSGEAKEKKLDGAIYSRDDLTINGSGSLAVYSEIGHGIVANDDLVITGGSIKVDAAEDGLHAHDSVRICTASLAISAKDDGITAKNDDESSYVYIESGNISIPDCYEGIESNSVTVAGGTLDITPTDDGINACGENGSLITISGGDIRIVNENACDSDGLDSNRDIRISGGRLFISIKSNGPSCAIDYGKETGGSCIITGGTVIACGSSAMLEGFSDDSTQGSIVKSTSQYDDNTDIVLKDDSGSEIIRETVPCGFSAVILSSPEITVGKTYTLTLGKDEEIITADNSSASAGADGFPHGGQGERPGKPGEKQGERPEMPPDFKNEFKKRNNE